MDGIAITWYAPVQQPLSSCCNERAQKLLRRSAGTVLSDFPVTPPDNKVLVYSGVLCSQRADFAKPVKTAARGRFLGKFAFPITDCLSEHSVPLPLYLLWHYRATTIDGTLNQVSAWTIYIHMLREALLLKNMQYSTTLLTLSMDVGDKPGHSKVMPSATGTYRRPAPGARCGCPAGSPEEPAAQHAGDSGSCLAVRGSYFSKADKEVLVFHFVASKNL